MVAVEIEVREIGHDGFGWSHPLAPPGDLFTPKEQIS
jgi:hypothetical protein